MTGRVWREHELDQTLTVRQILGLIDEMREELYFPLFDVAEESGVTLEKGTVQAMCDVVHSEFERGVARFG